MSVLIIKHDLGTVTFNNIYVSNNVSTEAFNKACICLNAVGRKNGLRSPVVFGKVLTKCQWVLEINTVQVASHCYVNGKKNIRQVKLILVNA